MHRRRIQRSPRERAEDASGQAAAPKWIRRLEEELAYRAQFEMLTLRELERELGATPLLSENHDTVVSIDVPHYCGGATPACGGPRGWCYTFFGSSIAAGRARKAALVDVYAERHPNAFADRVVVEVRELVRRGLLRYFNVRFAGSGELRLQHIPALECLAANGIRAWGFTKNAAVYLRLRKSRIACLFSCDATSDREALRSVLSAGGLLAYTSTSARDLPPEGSFVTFPVHVSGRVTEVADHPTLCPKVLEEYFDGTRREAWCQARCLRCHQRGDSHDVL